MRARQLLSLVISFSYLLRGEQESKGDDGYLVETPAVDGVEMRRMNLGIEDYTLGVGSYIGLAVRARY